LGESRVVPDVDDGDREVVDLLRLHVRRRAVQGKARSQLVLKKVIKETFRLKKLLENKNILNLFEGKT
jgi:hypothetical protein